MFGLLFILPFLFIFLSIFILLLIIPFLSMQYFNYSFIHKLLLKQNPNTKYSGFWNQWFPQIEIPTELIITIISSVVIFILWVTFLVLILLIRNYHNKNSTSLSFKIIIIITVLAVLMIITFNLLFLNFYILYIIAALLLINLIIIKILLNKNSINNDKTEKFNLNPNSQFSLFDNQTTDESKTSLSLQSSSLTSSTLSDDIINNSDPFFSNTSLKENSQIVESDEWISNFKLTNSPKENLQNNIESIKKTDPSDTISNALVVQPYSVSSRSNLNFFNGKIDLKFLEKVTYETLEAFIFIEFSHFKKYSKNNQNSEPVKIIEEEKKPENSFMNQLNDLINKKSE